MKEYGDYRPNSVADGGINGTLLQIMVRRLYPSIKRVLIRLALGSSGLLVLAGILLNMPVVQLRITHAMADWLSQRLAHTVVIDGARTNGFTYIHMDGISIPDLDIGIESIRIQYSLMRLVLRPNHPMAALTHVTIHRVPVSMVRNLDASIRASDWVHALVGRSQPKKRHAFRGVLTVTGLHGEIVDHRGWLKSPLPESFSRIYDDGAVYMDFRQQPMQLKANVVLVGSESADSHPVVKLNGEWKDRQDYQLTVSVQGVSVATWGPYFFHQPGYGFHSGRAAVTGKISPHSDQPNVPEFSFDIYAEHAQVGLPFFKPIIQNVTTRFRVTRSGLEFFPTTGELLNNPVQAYGNVGFQTKTIDLTVAAETIPSHVLESMLPVGQLPVSGLVKSAVLQVHGPLRQPVLSGQGVVPEVQPLPIAMIRDAVVGYRYHQKALTLRALGGTVYGGSVSGEAVLTFSPDVPTQLSGAFSVTGSPLWGDGQIELSGALNRYTTTVSVAPKTLAWQGQTVDAIHMVGVVASGLPIVVPTVSVVINTMGVVHGQGQVSRSGDVEGAFHGSGIPVLGGQVSMQSTVALRLSEMVKNPLAMQVQATVSGQALSVPNVGVGDVQATVVHNAARTVLTDGKIQMLGGEFLLSGVRNQDRITVDVIMRATELPPILVQSKWQPAIAQSGSTSGVAQVVYVDGQWQASGWQEATAIRVNRVPIHSAETHWTYSPNAWSLRQLTVAMPDTEFVANVRYGGDQQSVQVMAGSRIQWDTIRPWTQGYGDFSGTCEFRESQIVVGRDPYANIHADCASMQVNSLMLPFVSLAVQKHNDTIMIDTVRVRDAGGAFSFSGAVDLATQSVDVTAQFKHMAIEPLRRIAQQSYDEFLAIRQLVVSQTLDVAFMDPPVVGYAGNRLWGGESATRVFSSVVGAIEAQNSPRRASKFWDQLSGTVSGELAVVHSADRPWPMVTGRLDGRSIDMGSVVAKRIQLVLDNADDDAVAIVTAEAVQVGRAHLGHWRQTIRLTPTGELLFRSGHDGADVVDPHRVQLDGRWPLGAMINGQDAPISMTIQLPGAVWGALSLWVPALQSMHSEGPVQFQLGGALSRLNLVSGSIVFRKTTGHVVVGGDRVPIGIDDGVVVVKNNRIVVSDMGVHWRQLGETNRLVLSGPVDIQLPAMIGRPSASVRLALSVAPTHIQVVVPNRLSGRVGIESGQIVGQYPGRVTMRGAITLAHAVVTPQTSQSTRLLSNSLALDVGVTIGPNVSISGYMAQPTVLTVLSHYIDLKLESGHPPIVVQGPLNQLSLYNYIQVAEGYVQVVNRSFQLMSTKEQDQFFSQNSQKMSQNRVIFSGNSPPYLSFRALSFSDVRQQVVSANAVRDDTQLAMVAVIEGSPQSTQSVWFEQYRVGYPFLPSSLPEFRHKYVLQTTLYDALTATDSNNGHVFEALLSDGGESADNGIDQPGTVRVEQFGQHRLNAFFNTQVFRPVERMLQQRTGLYQVRIDYNPGQAILQSDDSVFVQSGVGVNFIEQITDRLYARVRTDFGVYDDNRPLSEYELSYYLRRNLSVNYGQTRRLNIVDDGFVPRLFIKYNHVF